MVVSYWLSLSLVATAVEVSEKGGEEIRDASDGGGMGIGEGD